MSAIRLPGPEGIRLIPVDDGMTPHVSRSRFDLGGVPVGHMVAGPVVSSATTPRDRERMAARREQMAEASKRYRERQR